MVVARDPGDWFDQTLRSLRAQDYPTLAVLVLDAGTDPELRKRVKSLIPDAAVRPVDGSHGYGAAVNSVTDLVQGASFYLLCHDDVALASDVVSTLVNEAFRTNAGIVGPKLVDWNDRDKLLAVGSTTDYTGVVAPYVDPGELDQEQHDRVRDVFFIPGACTLVRADLFTTLGGFDDEIGFLGDDLDFCWRAQIAGARVVVAPDAVVRHVEALGERRPVDDRRRLINRHRIRTFLACSGFLQLLVFLPILILLNLGELVYALVLGRFGHARDIASSWWWNLRRPISLLRKRRAVSRVRRVNDFSVRQLQVGGSARLRGFIRGQLAKEERFSDITNASRDLAISVTRGAARVTAVGWLVILVLIVLGARHLITRGVPVLGEFGPFPASTTDLWHDFWVGWSPRELGAPEASPTGLGVLGGIGPFTLADADRLRSILILGSLVVGPFGAWRLAGRLGSRRGALAAAGLYLALPLGVGAVASGSWTLLTLWAAAPLILRRILGLTGLAPFGAGGGTGAGSPARGIFRQAVGLGVLMGVVGAFTPSVLMVAALMVAGVLAGSLLVGGLPGAVRAAAGALLAAAVSLLLNIVWVADLVAGPVAWRHMWGLPVPAEPRDLSELSRFVVGDLGQTPLAWAFLGVAFVPLLVARGARFGWTVRAWGVILLSIGGAWAVSRDWLPGALPDPSLVLVAAGPAIALCGGLAVASFESDLADGAAPLRRALIPVTILGFGAAAVSAGGGLLGDGRLGLPQSDVASVVGFLDDQSGGGHRTLWLGDPRVLPTSGEPVTETISWAVTTGGYPTADDLLLRVSVDRTGVGAVVASMLRGDTVRVGESLGPLGVRYVVLVQQRVPSFVERDASVLDPALELAATHQLDLARTVTDRSVQVYDNEQWMPIDAVLDPDTAARAVSEREAIGEPIQLVGSDARGAAVATGDPIYSARPTDSPDQLELDGEDLDTNTGFDVGQLARAPGPGELELVEDAPARVGGFVTAAIWLVVLAYVAAGWAARARSSSLVSGRSDS